MHYECFQFDRKDLILGQFLREALWRNERGDKCCGGSCSLIVRADYSIGVAAADLKNRFINSVLVW